MYNKSPSPVRQQHSWKMQRALDRRTPTIFQDRWNMYQNRIIRRHPNLLRFPKLLLNGANISKAREHVLKELFMFRKGVGAAAADIQKYLQRKYFWENMPSIYFNTDPLGFYSLIGKAMFLLGCSYNVTSRCSGARGLGTVWTRIVNRGAHEWGNFRFGRKYAALF